MSVDLPLKKRKIIRVGKYRGRKRIPEIRDRREETVTVPIYAGVDNLNRMWMCIGCLACAPWTPQRRNITCQLHGTATREITIEEGEREAIFRRSERLSKDEVRKG
ncbi:MAG: hypothetical protein AAGM46_28430 [Cyanobacteria bacterium J06582_2]